MPGFFTCTAWLTVNRVFQCHPCSAVAQYEKGYVWRSDGPPQYFDLPCFFQHLYLYLNTPSHLSLCHENKKNETTQYIKGWIWLQRKRKKIIFEMLWHWNDNSPIFFKNTRRKSLYWCASSVLLTRDSSLDILFNQLCFVGTSDLDERTLTKIWFPLIVTRFNLLCAPGH